MRTEDVKLIMKIHHRDYTIKEIANFMDKIVLNCKIEMLTFFNCKN